MELNPVPFGGLAQLEADEIVPLERSIVLTDAYMDDGILRPRWGYRDVLNAAIGSNGDDPQLLGRMRVSPTSAKTVSVQAGAVRLVTDPTTETASDGSVAAALSGSPFSTGQKISGAMLNKDFYLQSDGATNAQRIRGSDFTLEDLGNLPAPGQPTATAGTLAWKNYRTQLAATWTKTVSGCQTNTTQSGLLSDWVEIAGPTGADDTDPSDGATIIIDMQVAGVTNLTGADWILFGVTPHDSGIGGKHVLIAISSDGTNFYQVGDCYDPGPKAGSTNIVFCDISVVPDTVKGAWRYIRFTTKAIGEAASNLTYGIYGHVPIYGRPTSSPVQYFASVYDEVTQQESALSPAREVTISNDTAKLPVYTDQFIGSNSWLSTNAILSPLDPANPRDFNREAGKPQPSANVIGVPETISGNAPSGYSGTKSIRVWRQTPSGIRLIGKTLTVAAGGAYSVVDTGSAGIAANERYKPGGTMPPCNAMGAFAGRIVVGGNPALPNRLYFSSFTPTSDTANGAATTRPIPKFPDIPEETFDGWSLDIMTAYDDQILSIIGQDKRADVLYIVTATGVWYMPDVDAPLSGYPQVYHMLSKGALGRGAVCYAEDTLFVASTDGLYAVKRGGSYMTVGGAYKAWSELTESNRRLWETFAPTTATVVEYQKRKLYVYSGSSYLRYDFVRQEWSGPHTIADTTLHALSYRDVSGTVEQLYLYTSGRKLARVQSSCVNDMQVGTSAATGTVPPPWVYGTGYAFASQMARVKQVLLDIASGQVELSIHGDFENKYSKSETFRKGVHLFTIGADAIGHYFRMRYKGIGAAVLRRVLWDHEPLDAQGPNKASQRP